MDEYIKKSDLIAYITRKRDFINQNSDYYGKDGYYIADDICTDILGDIYSNVIPSAEPKTGHWILQPSNKEQGGRDFIWWKCSECGQVIYSETEKDRREYHAFCGRCGANMSQKPTGSKDVIWYSKRNYSEIVVEPQERSE